MALAVSCIVQLQCWSRPACWEGGQCMCTLLLLPSGAPLALLLTVLPVVGCAAANHFG